MSKEVTVEVDPRRELEIAPSIEINQAKFDAIIQFAQQAEKMGRALDSIRNFVLGRAFPGDWVRFGDKLELSGPAAERVVSSLALMGVPVSFTNWRYWKDTGSDKNGEWFTWWYEADVDISGLHVEKVQGRAGSRDKFFGFESGEFKDLGDVKEADVRMAARRGVIKEGIKMAMGLRSIPAEHAQKLGLDPTKIKTVEFGGGGAGAAGTTPAEAKTPLLLKHVGQRKLKKKDGTEGTIYVAEDERGTKYETFSESLAKTASEFWKAGKKVLIDWTPPSNPKFAPKLNAISEADASQPDPETQGDAHEGAAQ